MKRLIAALIGAIFCHAALATNLELREHDADSVMLGPFCAPDVAGVVVEDTLDFDLTGLMVSIVSNTGVAFHYTNITGAQDGGNNQSLFTDSGESFPVDEFIGLTVYNQTDGSSGTVTDNDGTTITATLAGGTDNDWDDGDVMQLAGDIDDVTASGTWEDPDGIALDAVTAGAAEGCVIVHIRDEVLATASASRWEGVMTDLGTAIMDRTFQIVATTSDVNINTISDDATAAATLEALLDAMANCTIVGSTSTPYISFSECDP